MRSVIVGIGLFLMCLPLSYLLVKSTVQYWIIHRRLRISMASFRKEWNELKHSPADQFDLLDLVYRSAIFQLYPKMKMKRKRLEQLVSGELKRMVKYGWGASFSVFGRGLLATVMIGMSVFSGHVVWKEAKQFDVAAWLEPKQVNSEASALGKTFKLPYEIRSPKTLGTAIAFHMSRFDDHFTIQYTGDATNMKQTLDAAWEWVEQNYIYIYRLQRGGESEFREQNGSVDITIRLEYDMTAEEAEQVQTRVDQVIAQMPKQLSQVEKVKYINDYVVLNTTYHLDSQASPYTPYSILLNGEGVCEGYALTTLLLLEAAGLDTKYISGKAGDGLHAWNLVQVDDEWYHLDTTWNDPLPDRPNEVGYDYFLVSDATMRQDHTWMTDNYPVTAIDDYIE